MICTYCGHESALDFSFCPNCGQAAPTPVPAPAPTPEPVAAASIQEPAPQAYVPPVQPTYAPPQQSYVPPQQTYTPPQQGYIPPQQTYVPPQQGYVPPQPVYAPQPVVPLSPAAAGILPALKDNLFFIICILVSAACALSLMAGTVPIIELLCTIFLWLTYTQSRKGIADAKHLRQLSGTLFAEYILGYVAAGLLVLCGLLFSVIFSAFASDAALMDALTGELSFYFGDTVYTQDVLHMMDGMAAIIGVVFATVFVFIGAAVAVVNAFAVRYFHQFVQSAYRSLQAGVLNLKHTGGAKAWLVVFAVFYGLSALGNLSSGLMFAMLQSGCACAVCILGSMLIGKYFPKTV